ncbi:unnamed protein product [Sphagnum jensenii]|uniref:Uncharacterized protein n=1 Tax=Sphagnum jensenii TaxID=128206 RepID=A0ABP1BVF1_9BRYO
MIERDVRGSTDESGEEGVAEDAANDLAKAKGNVTTTTTTAVATNWNEVDLIDWGTTKSQETFAQPQAPHGGAGVEGTASSHLENVAVVAPPPLQQWNLMDSDLFELDASAPHPAAQSAAGVVLAISSSVPPAAGASEITRVKSMGPMGSGRSEMGCAVAVPLTDTGKEGGWSSDQTPLRRAENPVYSRSKSAAHVMNSSRLLHKPLLGAAMEELNEQEIREEAKRMAQREAERVHHEMVKLAVPEPQSSMHIKERMKASKGVSRFLHRIMVSREEKVQNSFDTWHTREAKHSSVDARQAKLVMPRSTFLKDLVATVHGSSKPAIKAGPPHLASKQELHFGTVESHLRDGPAWTVQEYMIRNNRWKEVEEVGGIDNFLFNLQFDDFDDFDDIDDDDDDDDDDW